MGPSAGYLVNWSLYLVNWSLYLVNWSLYLVNVVRVVPCAATLAPDGATCESNLVHMYNVYMSRHIYIYIYIYILDSHMAPSGARIVAHSIACIRTVGSMGFLVSIRLNAMWLEFKG